MANQDQSLTNSHDQQLCQAVNRHFMKTTRGLHHYTCIFCRKIYGSRHHATMSSTFWKTTRCLAGHGQSRPLTTTASASRSRQHRTLTAPGATNNSIRTRIRDGVCHDCDQNLIYDILCGKLSCRREGCRRLVWFNEDMVADILAKSSLPQRDFDYVLFLFYLVYPLPKKQKREKKRKEKKRGEKDRITNTEYSLFFDLVEKYMVYECQVHFDTASLPSRAALYETCNHDQNVCNDCMGTDLETKTRENRLRELKCLDPECRVDLHPMRVRALVGPECIQL